MASCKAACTDNMHIVVDCLSGNFLRCLEKTANIDVKSEIREATCDDFCATIMTVLAHLGDEDARVAALSLGERLNIGHGLLVFCLTLIIGLLKRLFAVGSADYRILGNMATVNFLESHANFAYCGPLLCCFD